MARINTNSADIATIAIHAPAMNLVTSTTISTAPVQMNPMVLITRERIIRRRSAGLVSVRRCRVQCRTMPIWLSVNEMNTPTMYSWISAVTSARKATTNAMAASARNRMPLEKASRSPRVCNCRAGNGPGPGSSPAPGSR